jgi:short-subunit dehydrogenase
MQILITGAAGSIGSALARAFRARNPAALLTLVDLSADATASLALTLGGDTERIGWDLARVEALPAQLAALVARRGAIDVLVNCAGIMEMRSLAGTPWELGERLLAIDLLCPLRLMSLVTPGMIARRNGVVVNVASMAAVTPLRGCAYYGAAKAGLAMASEIARLELLAEGVQVLTVYPGPVRSELERRARAQVPDGLAARMLPTGDPEPLAERIVEAVARGEARVVYPTLYEVANRLPRIAGWVTSQLSPRPYA